MSATPIAVSDLFKGAQPATSLETSDRLLAIKSSGELVKISQQNAVEQDTRLTFTLPASTEERWIRIAKMNEYGSCCFLTIAWYGWADGWCWPVGLQICAPHGGSTPSMIIKPYGPARTTTNGRYPFSKIRISGQESAKLIDILVPAHTVDYPFVVVLSQAIGASLIYKDTDLTTLPTVKEIEVADLWGGVKRYRSISYKLPRLEGKGGRHERNSPVNLQLLPQRSNVGCVSVSRMVSRECKRLHDSRLLRRWRGLSGSACWSVQLRQAKRDQWIFLSTSLLPSQQAGSLLPHWRVRQVGRLVRADWREGSGIVARRKEVVAA